MNRQQRFLCKMLDEIRTICDNNGITYFIGFGTLIGAVRNKGFLPWDDDIDVIMTYDNWLAFKEACKTQLPPNRYLGSSDEDVEYDHLLPRYISTDTTAIHTAQSLNDAVAGELIDIFILDPISDDPKDYENYRRDLYLYTTLINYANVSAYRINLDPELYKHYLNMEREKGALYVRQLLEKKLASYHSAEGEHYAFRWQGAPVLFKRWWFEAPVPVAFEGSTVNAPKGISEYLTFYYGEEWSEVPGNIAPAKHNTAASMDFSYKDALEYFHPTFNQKELLRETEERRYLVLQHAPANNRQKDEIASAKAKVVQIELEKHLKENRAEFDAAFAAKDGRKLARILRSYLSFQVSGEMIGRNSDKGYYRYINPILIDVPDDVFEAGLYGLMATGRIRHAHMLLDKRLMLGRKNPEGIQFVEDAIHLFNEACDDYQFERFAQGRQKARKLHADIPCVDAFLKLVNVFELAVYRETGAEQDLAAFKAGVDEGLKEYPTDGFFLKQLGDWQYAVGDDDAGRTTYLQSAELTRNGLALLDISEKIGYYPTWLRNPSWAGPAGVPQWNEPLPEPPAQFVKNTPKPADERQEFLMKLLAEVTQTCERLSIPYVLGPHTAQALFKQNLLPGNTNGYQVVVRASDALRLFEQCRQDMSENRSVEYMGNSDLKTRELRYHADDTLLMDLKKDAHTSFNSLYVRILPLEPASYGDKFEERLTQWNKDGGVSKPKGKRAKLRAVFHKLKGAKFSGDALWHEAMGAKVAGTPYMRMYKHPKKFDDDWLANTDVRTFRSHEMRVPHDFNAYLEATKPKPTPKSLSLSEASICSVHLNMEELVKSGGIDEDFFARRAQNWKDTARERQILKDFRFNFQQVKLAVETKKLADKLLPRKEELLALRDQGKYEQLGHELSAYIPTAKKYRQYGDCNFDDDLFALMKETQKQLNPKNKQ